MEEDGSGHSGRHGVKTAIRTGPLIWYIQRRLEYYLHVGITKFDYGVRKQDWEGYDLEISPPTNDQKTPACHYRHYL